MTDKHYDDFTPREFVVTVLKGEFRMAQTMIRPVENNPLKFAPNVEEALVLLLRSGNQAFMPADLAISESFDDLKAHQLAVMAGVEGGSIYFNVAFTVVLTSLVLQGSTIAWSARRLNVVVPDLDDTEHARLVFGDFVLAATTSMGELCAFYGLDLPCDADKLEKVTLAAFGQRRKMLRQSLKPIGGEALLARAEIDPQRRAETLSVEEFCRLANLV